jgi:broad specificity phosphatase PhoE
MGVLLLVRHGQASFEADDYDVLSDTGHAQGAALGRALADRGIRPDLVVRGAMRRHRETADAAIEAAGWTAAVQEDAGWDEFDHVTTIAGMPDFAFVPGETYEQRVARADELISRWASGEHDAEYHEDFPSFCTRVDAALARTLERVDASGTAVVFTSGGPVSWVAASLLDGGVPVWARLSRVVVNASVTKVVLGRRGASLVTFNDHSHVEAEPSLLTYR